MLLEFELELLLEFELVLLLEFELELLFEFELELLLEFELELLLWFELELLLEFQLELLLWFELEFLEARVPSFFRPERSPPFPLLGFQEGLVGFLSLIVLPSAGSGPSSAACSAAPIPKVGTSPAT